MRAPKLSVWRLLLLSLLFAAVFAGTFFAVKGDAAPVSNPKTAEMFQNYGMAVGPILAAIFFFSVLALIGLKNLFWAKRFVSGNAFSAFAVAAAFAWFWWFLVFQEPRNTEVARAIIDFLGKPMLYASAATAFVAFDLAVLGTVLKSDSSDSDGVSVK